MVSVHVLSFDPAGVNCGIITGGQRSLLVDSGPGPLAARTLMDRAVELGEGSNGRSQPVDVVITHDHWDHFFGTAELVRAGAETVHASASFAADQEATAWIALDAVRSGEESDDYLGQLPLDPMELVVAVSPVDGSPDGHGTLDLGDCPVEFHVLGGHSTADLIVRLPQAGIVFAGDLVEEGAPPQAGADASLSEWASSLRALLDFPEAEIFVPGHGHPVDRSFVERQLADVEGLREKQSDAEVALPSRALPGEHDRRVPREIRVV
ncbi:MBL fold metallo-hydrolase [Brevibacterium sp. GP-SGM9]|uniref:MBL fold metallo-hydrolase n=1 Tax=Brevibacterium sp. GP-SGM9 TaxID=3376990 RepID=UPI0039A772F5